MTSTIGVAGEAAGTLGAWHLFTVAGVAAAAIPVAAALM